MPSFRLAAALLLFPLASACAPGPESPSPGSRGGTGGGGRGGSGEGGGTGGGGGSTSADAAPRSVDTGAAVVDGQPSATGDCAALPASLLCNPLRKMPKSIKETGLFPAAPDLTKVSPRMLEFVPDPPLWSNGLDKQRFLLLPQGKKVDNTNSKEWIFPIGTILVKTFFDDGGAGGTPRPIETRFIRRVADKDSPVPYEFHLYKWNDDRTDATLIVNDIDGDVTADMAVQVTINRMVANQRFMVNGGKPFPHTLPSRNACGDCHEENGKIAQTFIGFDELRLNSKRTPASTKTQLQEFYEAGIFTAMPPANPARITDAKNDQRVIKVKSFVFGNCAHCHNGNPLEDFRPDVFEKNTVGVPVRPTQSVMPPPGMLRIFPKDPRKSVVYVQTERTMLPPATGDTIRLRPMPPVGVTDLAADQQALADMAAWINSLPAK